MPCRGVAGAWQRQGLVAESIPCSHLLPSTTSSSFLLKSIGAFFWVPSTCPLQGDLLCTASTFTFNGSVRGSPLGWWPSLPNLVLACMPTLALHVLKPCGPPIPPTSRACTQALVPLCTQCQINQEPRSPSILTSTPGQSPKSCLVSSPKPVSNSY